MKKQLFTMMTLMAALVASLTACSSDENIVESNKDLVSNQKMTIVVEEAGGFIATDGTPQKDNMTRAIPATDASNNQIKAGTTFEMGDAIGIYEVSNGFVTKANVPYYYSGTVWDSATEISFDADKTYYAYYPYSENAPTGAPALNDNVSGSGAETFFNSLINSWSVFSDQTDYDNYKASDLMVGSGTRTITSGGNTVMTFSMSHQMGLVVLNLGQVKHMLRSGNYYWLDQVNRKCKGSDQSNTFYKPAFILNEYRAIVPVGQQAKFCATDNEWAVNAHVAQRGHYQYYTIGYSSAAPDAGIKYYDLQLGDVYYSDGSLMHVTADNADARMARVAEAEGFVVFISDGSAEDQKVIDPRLSNGVLAAQYSHALVMRIESGRLGGNYVNSSTQGYDVNANMGQVIRRYANNGHSVKKFYTIAAAINDYDGINTTNMLVGTDASYDAWYNAAHDGPSGANVPNSGWFVPGLGQVVHSYLQTGTISPETYTALLATNSDDYQNLTTNPAIIRQYMQDAIGATTKSDTPTITDDALHMTSTYNANATYNFNFWVNALSNGSHRISGSSILQTQGRDLLMLAF